MNCVSHPIISWRLFEGICPALLTLKNVLDWNKYRVGTIKNSIINLNIKFRGKLLVYNMRSQFAAYRHSAFSLPFTTVYMNPSLHHRNYLLGSDSTGQCPMFIRILYDLKVHFKPSLEQIQPRSMKSFSILLIFCTLSFLASESWFNGIKVGKCGRWAEKNLQPKCNHRPSPTLYGSFHEDNLELLAEF